jgi:hypothetical protein
MRAREMTREDARGESMVTEALAVCKALADAGIWVELHPETQTLVLGPTARVQAQPELLQQVRAQKSCILEALQEALAYEVVSVPGAGRFQVETCATCQQSVFVIASPLRLAVHRTPNGDAVCPGAIRAQEVVTQALMSSFIAERCVQRPGAVLTWMALRGAVEGWAREHECLLPPRPYLIAWMDAHYKRLSHDEVYASWYGLTFTLQEWFGDDDVPALVVPPTRALRPKTVLKA